MLAVSYLSQELILPTDAEGHTRAHTQKTIRIKPSFLKRTVQEH